MKINLGCSGPPEVWPVSYVNVDICPPCDQIADLTRNWPWADSTIEAIRGYDIIEHLPNKIFTMNEAHRVLIPGGLLDIVVPSTRGAGAWCDPTHQSYWNASSFEYFEKGNFARERFRQSYGITADFKILKLEQTVYKTKYDDIWKVGVLLEAIK